MIKIYKYGSLAIMAMMGASVLLSCDNSKDYFGYDVYPGAVGADIYFPSNAQTQYVLDANGGSFTIPISRNDDTEAQTVSLTVESISGEGIKGVLEIPTSVTFSQGAKTAELVVSYPSKDDADIEYDTQMSYLIGFSKDYQSPFAQGSTEISINAYYPSPWTQIPGTGKYYDEFWGVNDDDDNWAGPVSVSVWQNDLDKNLFRISNPYVYWNGEDNYFQFRLLQPGDVYLDQTIPDLGVTVVAYSDYFVEYYSSYDDDVYLVFPGRFSSLSDPTNWVYNYVVDWQDNGLPGEIHISPYFYMFNNGGWNNTTSEPITIIFPGYEQLDTSVEVVYNGMLTKPDNSLAVMAYVELGADVTEAKVAVVPGGSVSSAALEGIEDGSIESVSISSSQSVQIDFDSANEEGKYSIVAVAYYNGESRGYSNTSFTYTPADAETWAYVATGTYYYLPTMWGDGEDDVVTDILDLYESEKTPGKFKLDNWMGEDYPLVFTLDDAGNITIKEQDTGVNTSYGMLEVQDMNTYFGIDSYPAYLEDGVYNLAVVYFVSEGYFDYGYEYFVPSTSDQTEGAKTATRSNNSIRSSKSQNIKAKLHKLSHDQRIKRNALNIDHTVIK